MMHAGLHHIADETPVGRSWKPIYHLNKEDNLTGTPRQALPKGSWHNPSQVVPSAPRICHMRVSHERVWVPAGAVFVHSSDT